MNIFLSGNFPIDVYRVSSTSARGRRLSKEVIDFIKEGQTSYKENKEQIRSNWKIEVAKSTIRYYKRQMPRIKPIMLDSVSSDDWDWLQGLFAADGNKGISKDKYGKHYIVRIALDKVRDSLIAEKCARIVKAIGLVPTILIWGNCLNIKISSKQLFNALKRKIGKTYHSLMEEQQAILSGCYGQRQKIKVKIYLCFFPSFQERL